jgi:hypothetical protein
MPHARRSATLVDAVAGAALAAGCWAGAFPAVAAAQSTALVGAVRDSITGDPLAGATVQLVPAATPQAAVESAVADSAGAYRFEAVAPGRYWVTFLHPRLDSLGLEPPQRPVTVAAGGGPVRADLGVPGATALATAVCGPGSRDGALLGRLLDAESGAPAAAGVVRVRWGEVTVGVGGVRRAVRELRAPVGAGGRFAACDVPTGQDVRVEARAPARSDGAPSDSLASGTVDLRFDDARALYRDLWVARDAGRPPERELPVRAPGSGAEAVRPAAPDAPAPAAGAWRRGTAALAGRVRRPDGRPFAGARVLVRGTGAADTLAVTDAEGAYRLAALPAGTRSVDVLAVDFTPVRAAVDLRPGRVTALDVALTRRVAALAEVRVYAASIRAGSEFALRRRLGIGRFLTAADLARFGARSAGDAVAAVPGLRVADTRFGRPVVVGRQGCTPTVYVDRQPVTDLNAPSAAAGWQGLPDGVPNPNTPRGTATLDDWVRLPEIGGVEAYPNGAEAPPQYPVRGVNRLDAGCAVVLIWTKGALQ